MIKRYPFSLVMSVVIMYLIFLQMFYTSRTFGTESSILKSNVGSSDYMGYLLIGLVFWNLALRSLNDIGVTMLRDTMTGTIEHFLLSPTPSWVLLIGRALSSFIITILFLTFLCVPLMFLFSIQFHAHVLVIILIFLLTAMGIQGISYILAGLQFLVKNIGGITQLLNFVMLFLCGVVFPKDLLPKTLQVISQLIPITLGLESARQVLLGDVTSTVYLGSELFWRLFAQSVVFYLLGILIYNFFIAVSRRRGTLGKY